MGTDGQASGHVAGLSGRRRSSAGLASPNGDRTRASRRLSATFRRAVRNTESFHRNRGNRVQSVNDDVSILAAHRARTRAMTRREEERTSPTTAPPTEVWEPSIVIGTPLWLPGEDPSTIEIADRKAAQACLRAEHYPDHPYFAQLHQEAIREREQLDEADEANWRPRSTLQSTHDRAIQQRLEHLRAILQQSKFPPERANIEAAIASYESGDIPYSDSYTLIWAGRIVDRCPDFDSFTYGRSARLDRYHAEHGPGWLWYEPPLAGGGTTLRGHGATIVAKKGLCLENYDHWRHSTEGMGHYRARMGFRRRKLHVMRGEEEIPLSASRNSSSSSSSSSSSKRNRYHHRRSSIPGLDNYHSNNNHHHHHHDATDNTNTKKLRRWPPTVPDPDGPRVFYDTLLDSGATLPCLYESDLPALHIDPDRYAAQSSRSVATADALSSYKVFELDVGISFADRSKKLDKNGVRKEDESESEQEDEDEPMPTLGCTLPVVVFPGCPPSEQNGTAAHPDSAPDRLSGILPFLACYMSSAPGNFKLWMGEDRRDVLGAGRLPGQLRFGVYEDHLPSSSSKQGTKKRKKGLLHGKDEELLHTPKRVIFEHDMADGSERVLREEDVGGSSVLMSGPKGTDFDAAGDGLDAASKKDAVGGVEVVHVRRGRGGRIQPRRR